MSRWMGSLSAIGTLALLAFASCSDSESGASSATDSDGPTSSASSETTSAGGAATSAATSAATNGSPTTGSTTSGSSSTVSSSSATNTVTGSSSSSAGGSVTSTQTSSAEGATGSSDADVLADLEEYLAIEHDARPPIDEQSFARVPLSAALAESARTLIWNDYASYIAEDREPELVAKAITIGEHTLRYDYTTFGEEPETGHSLFISLHGGGEADASVNDEQWENQKILYEPDEGIYLAPRAPTNTWNLWHEAHVDGLLDRLITDFIVLEGIDPNRVYVMGYSAGGDGVYQLGPRMADRWAAAAMMAGHPNDAKPDSLRNLGFTIHVGGLDTSYDRNLVAEEWGTLLDGLEAADPEGYPHYVEIHPDKPHWMDLEDAVAVPWMAKFTRSPTPSRIVWLQDDITHLSSYWLAVEPDQAVAGARLEATLSGQSIALAGDPATSVKVRLSDALLDLDQPVSISVDSGSLYEGTPERTVAVLYTTTWERGDPGLVFSSEVVVELP